MSERVCLVEDDPTIGELVSRKLRARGYDVQVHADADPLLEPLAGPGSTELCDLYIVDVLLKGKHSGLDLCQSLRSSSATVPILILSALAESSDRVEGLRTGADDYLTKPFEMEELLLRVDGMLKRRSWYRALPEVGMVFAWDDNTIDFAKLEASRGKHHFSLGQKEGMLMKLLIEREGQIVTRDEILNQVWGYHLFPSTRTVDNFILRLRKQFEEEPKRPKYIHSVRGMGYKFTR